MTEIDINAFIDQVAYFVKYNSDHSLADSLDPADIVRAEKVGTSEIILLKSKILIIRQLKTVAIFDGWTIDTLKEMLNG